MVRKYFSNSRSFLFMRNVRYLDAQLFFLPFLTLITVNKHPTLSKKKKPKILIFHFGSRRQPLRPGFITTEMKLSLAGRTGRDIRLKVSCGRFKTMHCNSTIKKATTATCKVSLSCKKKKNKDKIAFHYLYSPCTVGSA